MNDTIHNFIRGTFRLFVPLIYLTFILAGILCALVSGLIEYEVFAELYQKNFGESKWIIFSVPFLVVFSFEIVKVFLIFLNKQSDMSANSHYAKDKSHFLRLRYILIFISFLCTLIYSFYNLQNPEYENVLKYEKEKLGSKYEKLETQVNESLNNQLELQTKQYKDDNIIQQEEIDRQKTIYFRGSNEFRGEKYEEATKLKNQNLTKIDEITANVEKDRIQQISNLEVEKQKEIKAAENELSNSASAGNKMLTATLKILNLNTKFPEWQYISLVGIISLILSIGLEYIIWSVFTVLAMNHGEIFDFSVQTSKYENATDAEMKMNKADAVKETQYIADLARSITNTIRNKAKEIFNRNKNNL